MKLSCDVIKDLLPLYHDEVCSEETKKLVEEHLKECESCCVIANKLGMEFHIPQKNLDETTFILGINKKITIRELRFTIISLIILCLVGISFHLARTYKFIPVAASSFRVSEISGLEDKTIGFLLEIKDGKDVSSMIAESPNEDGIVYIHGKRALLETFIDASDIFGYHQEYFYYNPYQRYNPETQEIYFSGTSNANEIRFGTEDDYIVIWKEGMELPAASEEMEKDWNRHTR